MSPGTRFPTISFVRRANAQTSLRIRTVWSEPLLVIWILYDCKVTHRTSFGVSKLNRALHRLVWVYSCQNAKLWEITCHSSYGIYEALRIILTATGTWVGHIAAFSFISSEKLIGQITARHKMVLWNFHFFSIGLTAENRPIWPYLLISMPWPHMKTVFKSNIVIQHFSISRTQ